MTGVSDPGTGVSVSPTGYDADGIALECPVCRKDLLWDEKQPLSWPLADLVKIAEDHQPDCVPFVPEPPLVMVKPVITPGPEPDLGERTVKFGGLPVPERPSVPAVPRAAPQPLSVRAYTPRQREVMLRHGYDPDVACRGVTGAGGTMRISGVDLRNRVCWLEGTRIDPHEGSDLDGPDPDGWRDCLHCHWEFRFGEDGREENREEA